MKKIFLFLTLILVINVNAATCDSTEKARLRELAKVVEFTYDYREDGDKYYWDITAHNISEDLRILNYTYDEFHFNEWTIQKPTLKGFENNSKVKVTIEGFTANGCSGEQILTKTISLPFYNMYSKNSNCTTYPDFKLCKETLSYEITGTRFYKELNAYIEELNKKEEENKEKEEKDKNKKIIFMIIGGVILVGAIVLAVINIKAYKKKNEL